jgi:hypothetical protein
MKIKDKKNKIKDAFSLIEALVAISILMIGILSAFILVIRTLANTPHIQSRLIAANLAQEGVELVRQIRDNNFALSGNFRENLLEGTYQIDSVDRKLEPFDKDNFLQFDNIEKLYSYQSGDKNPFYFQRKIIISNIEGKTNSFRVNVLMTWCVKRTESQCLEKPTYELNVEDHLYNYLNTTE